MQSEWEAALFLSRTYRTFFLTYPREKEIQYVALPKCPTRASLTFSACLLSFVTVSTNSLYSTQKATALLPQFRTNARRYCTPSDNVDTM